MTQPQTQLEYTPNGYLHNIECLGVRSLTTYKDIANEESKSMHLFSSNIYHDEICTKVSECRVLERIVDFLNEYQKYINAQMEMRHNNDHIVNVHKIVYAHCEIMNYNDVNLLNDFNHLLQSHANESAFEDIYDILCTKIYDNYACDLTKCLSLRRNQRDRIQIAGNMAKIKHLYFTTNNDEIVSQQLLDRIHCHYLHSFDVGFKIKKAERENILSKQIKTNADHIDADIRRHDTTIDGICELTAMKSSSYRHVSGLERLQSSNNKFMLNDNTRNVLNEYKYGFRFFYWKYYRFNSDKHDNVDDGVIDYNIPKHATNVGHTLMDLYITPKYSDLQDELLNNCISTVTDTAFKNEYKKAIIHLETNYFRSIKCTRKKSAENYELGFGWNITVAHIIAMMIYCGYDELQRMFSMTYRRYSDKETINDVKSRHSNFYYLGRLLREIVECFGMKRPNRAISVYHGANKKFMFESLFAFIKSPFSTTRDFCVATNFAGGKGIVLELSIDSKSWTFNRNEGGRICCFDCIYLSDFPNEQEIFCIGGLNKFHFVNIIEITGLHYAFYIKGLKQLTSGMIYGGIDVNTLDFDIPKTRNELQIVFRLLAHQYNKYIAHHPYAHKWNKLPNYIDALMDSHCKRIKSIHCVEKERRELIHPVLHSFFRLDDDWIKVNEIMAIFQNVTHITYYAHHKDIVFIKSVFESISRLLCHIKGTKTYPTLRILIDPEIEPQIIDIINQNQWHSQFIHCKIYCEAAEVFIKMKNKTHNLDEMGFYWNFGDLPISYIPKRMCHPVHGHKVMRLYHVTERKAAQEILKSRKMVCGLFGMFGGGIYFAESVRDATHKALSNGFVVTADVFIGRELVVKDSKAGKYTFSKLYNEGYDSICAPRGAGNGKMERVVFNSDQVRIVRVQKQNDRRRNGFYWMLYRFHDVVFRNMFDCIIIVIILLSLIMNTWIYNRKEETCCF